MDRVPPKPAAPDNLPSRHMLDWVWVEPVRPGDDGFPAGFPSTTNAALLRSGHGRWVLTHGWHAADWIEEHCVHPDGKWIGKSIVLEPWQIRILVEMFEVSVVTGLRLYRWVLIGIPKKQGKSTLCSALSLYLAFCGREPSAKVICAAASEDQADIVAGGAQTMVRFSDSLQNYLVVQSGRISCPLMPGCQVQRVAAATGTNDGRNCFVVICDELHEWERGKKEQVWNILTNGTGARDEPMVIQVTTAGWDQTTVCFRLYEELQELIEGTLIDDATWGVWFEAPLSDPTDDSPVAWDSDRAIELANPNLGVTVQLPFFTDQRRKKTYSTYARYFLNRWTEGDDIWEGAAYWDDLVGCPDLCESEPLFVGIDVANRHDATAIVACQWHEERQVLDVWQKIWENPYGRRDPRHATWRMDVRDVEEELLALYTRFPEPATEDEYGGPMPGPMFLYDPMFFGRSARVLAADGLTMIEHPQSEARMAACAQRLFELVRAGEVCQDGDPVMRRHIRSTAAKEVPRGWRLARASQGRRPNDACIALAMAAHAATQSRADPDSGTGFNIYF